MCKRFYNDFNFFRHIIWLIYLIDNKEIISCILGGEIDMKITGIELPMEEIAEFCHKWQVTQFAFFGSVLRDDFRSDSDIDVMVQFHPDAHPTFRTLDQMETELKALFHREVDLITRQGIETSRNYLRRHEILSSAQIIYATGSSIPA